MYADTSACTVSVVTPTAFDRKPVAACTLYHDNGPEPWLRKTSTDAWLSTGVGESIDGANGVPLAQGDIYCVVCYVAGGLEIFDVPNFSCLFSVDKFMSGKSHLMDSFILEHSDGVDRGMPKSSGEEAGPGRKENANDVEIVELAMHRWSGQHSRPFLFGILNDGTILCYHGYLFEGLEGSNKNEDGVSSENSAEKGISSGSRLRNLRFLRVSLDTYTRDDITNRNSCNRITIFKNVGGHEGLFLSGSRPSWFMVFRERLRIHPQVQNPLIFVLFISS